MEDSRDTSKRRRRLRIHIGRCVFSAPWLGYKANLTKEVGESMERLEFKSPGHFFSAGFKDIFGGLKNIILFANKSQAVAPEVEQLVGVLAGPLGSEIADLSFTVLGEIASALQQHNTGTKVTVNLEQEVIDRIKNTASMVESILISVGGKKPS